MADKINIEQIVKELKLDPKMKDAIKKMSQDQQEAWLSGLKEYKQKVSREIQDMYSDMGMSLDKSSKSFKKKIAMTQDEIEEIRKKELENDEKYIDSLQEKLTEKKKLNDDGIKQVEKELNNLNILITRTSNVGKKELLDKKKQKEAELKLMKDQATDEKKLREDIIKQDAKLTDKQYAEIKKKQNRYQKQGVFREVGGGIGSSVKGLGKTFLRDLNPMKGVYDPYTLHALNIGKSIVGGAGKLGWAGIKGIGKATGVNSLLGKATGVNSLLGKAKDTGSNIIKSITPDFGGKYFKDADSELEDTQQDLSSKKTKPKSPVLTSISQLVSTEKKEDKETTEENEKTQSVIGTNHKELMKFLKNQDYGKDNSNIVKNVTDIVSPRNIKDMLKSALPAMLGLITSPVAIGAIVAAVATYGISKIVENSDVGVNAATEKDATKSLEEAQKNIGYVTDENTKKELSDVIAKLEKKQKEIDDANKSTSNMGESGVSQYDTIDKKSAQMTKDVSLVTEMEKNKGKGLNEQQLKRINEIKSNPNLTPEERIRLLANVKRGDNIRETFNENIHSGYEHYTGQAVDIRTSDKTPQEIAQRIKEEQDTGLFDTKYEYKNKDKRSTEIEAELKKLGVDYKPIMSENKNATGEHLHLKSKQKAKMLLKKWRDKKNIHGKDIEKDIWSKSYNSVYTDSSFPDLLRNKTYVEKEAELKKNQEEVKKANIAQPKSYEETFKEYKGDTSVAKVSPAPAPAPSNIEKKPTIFGLLTPEMDLNKSNEIKNMKEELNIKKLSEQFAFQQKQQPNNTMISMITPPEQQNNTNDDEFKSEMMSLLRGLNNWLQYGSQQYKI
jgi:hypothetical protein